MLFKSTFVAGLLAAIPLVLGMAAHKGGMSCGTPSFTTKQQALYQEHGVGNNSSPSFKAAAAQGDFYVNTYIHVVAKSQYVSDGYLTRDTINTQMNVLNQYFRGTGFQYKLVDVDWTVDSNWAAAYDEYNMKRYLRKGDYRTLNLYFLGSYFEHSGYCNYPLKTGQGSDAFYYDGCIIGAWASPGGSNSAFSTGRIAVHEVGHWNGLVHTFGEQNSCTGNGDFVADTPAQYGPSSGCPSSRDSCPNQPGYDPIHNHMDYTDDYCRTEFTQGQIKRMVDSWYAFRA